MKTQVHIFCNPELYQDFKEAISKFNKTNNKNVSISETIRYCMKEFIKTQWSDNNANN